MLNLHEADPIEQLREMSVHLKGEFEEGQGAAKMSLNNEWGKGFINTFRTVPGLALRCYNITFQKEMRFEIGEREGSPIYLLYCIKGHYYHQFENEDNSKKLLKGHNVIISASPGKTHIVRFPVGVVIKLSVIIISEPKLSSIDKINRPDLIEVLKKIRKEVRTGPSIRFIGVGQSLVNEHAKLLIENVRTDTIGRLLSEASLLYTMAYQLEDRKRIIESNKKNTSLKPWEIEKIVGLSDLLQNNISDPITIRELSEVSGIYERKLQEGFRYLFGKSVAEFVRHYRIQKAKELFETTNLTVAEVSHQVGIPNRSYFAKTFKLAFGKSPKDYKRLYEMDGWSFELSYKSKAASSIGAKEITEIVERSNAKNFEKSITGCLVYYKGEFFQFLEGPKKSVLELYDLIKGDKRHYKVQLIWKGARRKRVFRDSGMALVSDINGLGQIERGLDLGLDIDTLKAVTGREGIPALQFWEKVRNTIRLKQKEKREDN